MSESHIIWMIIGMGLVTYIPRILPLITAASESWPDWLRRMLTRVPYAVLGALIFPGILYSLDSMAAALAGGVAALILSWLRAPLLAVVAGAILLVTLLRLSTGL
ncbi:AzlD domain-containing protein [Alkalicoccus urumqiensis]|uniref:Branched-chain amino acid transporter n=1 Tax=Alkalicoccus urumqiensis TaxID=1548213 RepID=A0A2P6MD68_ALKUR|nr:AzlD domain-containing protein [Alkalicoccus urumqiensis]PRO64224.1 branched-chain amino acid transporter [Alkalicoccus urumqiensis]